MPSFSEKEKNIIRKKILEEGERQFNSHGLQKTTIQDITSKVGIAKGSFYSFFPSKEMLYFEILENIEKIREDLLKQAVKEEEDPPRAMENLLKQSRSFVENTPLISDLYHPETLARLWRKIPPERQQSHLKEDEKAAAEFFTDWKKKGKLADISGKVAVAIIRAYVLLVLQKEMIGEDVYPAVMEHLARFIAAGLCKGGTE